MLLIHSAAEGIAIAAQFVEQVLRLVALLLQALDDVRRRFGGEGRIAELAVGVGDVLLLLRDFLVQLFAFGGDVDFALVDRPPRRIATWNASQPSRDLDRR